MDLHDASSTGSSPIPVEDTHLFDGLNALAFAMCVVIAMMLAKLLKRVTLVFRVEIQTVCLQYNITLLPDSGAFMLLGVLSSLYFCVSFH